MLKYLFLAVLAAIFITASDPFFGTNFTTSKKIDATRADVEISTHISFEQVRPFLTDYQERVNASFKITPYYYPTVQFWFMMYTKYPSSHVVIHDKKNLAIMYRVMDFSHLRKAGTRREAYFGTQQKLAGEEMKLIKALLSELVLEPLSTDSRYDEIFEALKRAQFKLPDDKNTRSKLFLLLSQNLRTQTGQRDFIGEGLVRSRDYYPFLKKLFQDRELPPELLAIPFLESSFNPKAASRVKALGIWQFMPLIGSYYLPTRTPNFDYRGNVGTASLAASFLMRENHKLLGRWDLAVTAYNSGTKHIFKAKRALKDPDLSLADIIRNSKSESFGFASKNFYGEFLALVHVLAYQEQVFRDYQSIERPDIKQPLRYYLTRCPMRIDHGLPSELFEEIKTFNHHVTEWNNILPQGFIVTTKAQLPNHRFLEVPREIYLKVKPIDWRKKIKLQSCSTI